MAWWGGEGPVNDMAEEAEATAQELRTADIVLTTYRVLAEEVNLADAGRSLRHAKRYRFSEGPLMRVGWVRFPGLPYSPTLVVVVVSFFV